ncbi:MAG: hypothetical protein ACI4LE_04775, partial [Faecalibacterium sp.]
YGLGSPSGRAGAQRLRGRKRTLYGPPVPDKSSVTCPMLQKNLGLRVCAGRVKSFFGSFFSKKEQKESLLPLFTCLCAQYNKKL